MTVQYYFKLVLLQFIFNPMGISSLDVSSQIFHHYKEIYATILCNIFTVSQSVSRWMIQSILVNDIISIIHVPQRQRMRGRENSLVYNFFSFTLPSHSSEKLYVLGSSEKCMLRTNIWILLKIISYHNICE